MDEVIQLVRSYQEAATLDQRLALGDDLLRRISPDLQLFVLASVSSDVSADLLQDILLAITRGLNQFRGATKSAFWGWCYRIARNKLTDHFRRKPQERRVESLSPEELWELVDTSAAAEPISLEDKEDLTFAVQLLSKAKPECLDLLWQHFVLGLEYAEIAEEKALSYDNTRRRIGRCLDTAQVLMSKRR